MEFDELPDDWTVQRFDDVLQIRKGSVDPSQFRDEQFHLFSIPAHDEGDMPETKLGREIGSSKTAIAAGDCLFSKLNPRIPRTWVVPPTTGQRQIASTEFWPIRSRFERNEAGYLAPEFLKWLFRYEDFLDGFRGDLSGGVQSRQRLKQDILSDVEVPVPPLAEQPRVVARIEALTSRLTQSNQARQVALIDTEKFRQAFWDATFSEIPDELWGPIGEHAKVQGGYAFKSEWFVRDGIRLLRNQNVYHGELEWSDAVHLPAARRGEFPKFVVKEGDIVITMDRPLIKAGLKAARVRKQDLPCLLLQRVGRFIFDKELLPDYLFHFLFSQAFMQHIAGDGRSCAVPHISPKQIESIRIPVPSTTEQRRIVERFEALTLKLDELRRLQREVEAELAAFVPALLAKAFRGEL